MPDPEAVRRLVLADDAAQRRVAARLGLSAEQVKAACDVDPKALTKGPPAQTRLQGLLDHTAAPLGLTHQSVDGRWLSVNASFCELLGRPREQLLGMRVADHTHSDDVARDWQTQQRLIAGTQRTARLEKRFVDSDGGEVWVELHLALLRDAAGKPQHFVSVVVDIRARRAAESQSAFLRHGIEQSAVPIVWLCRDGRVVFANGAACDALRWPRAEFTSESCDVTDNRAEPRPWLAGGCEAWQAFANDLRPDSVLVREVALERGDGEGTIPAQVTASRLDYRGEQFVLASFHDLTEARQLQRALQRAQKMEAIGMLAGGIAHDFNNLLVAILGYTQLAAEDIADPNAALAHLREGAQAAERARDLVQNVLTFSRRGEDRRRQLDVGPVVKECLRLLRSSLPATIAVRSEVEGAPLVEADPTQVHQVLMNLCTNAFHAMEDSGGVLRVALHGLELHEPRVVTSGQLEPGRWLELAVSDEGHGIDPGLLDKVFDPYFTTKEAGKGTGLGLSIVHGIAQEHGGAVHIGTGEDGRGTRVAVYLPALRAEAPQVEHEDPDVEPAGDVAASVLLVEDKDYVADVATRVLRRRGFRVSRCADAATALAALEASPSDCDLLITDLTMPGLCGDELAEQAHAIRPELPIILCSGYQDRLAPERIEQLGVDAVLLKPFQASELLAAVQRVLAGRSRSR